MPTSGETICGGTTITFGDQLRASWNGTAKYSMLLFAIVVVIIISSIQSPLLHAATWLEISLFVFALALTVLMFVLFSLLLSAVLVTALFALRMGPEQRAISYEIGAENVLLRDRTGTTLTTPWGAVRRARETARAFRFVLKTGTRYIPKRAFADSDIAAVRVLLRERLGGKAKLSA